MGVRAHISKTCMQNTSAKIQAQTRESLGGNTSAKFKRKTTKPVAGNFLETICWEILGNYILGNSSGYQGFLMGVIMAQCYSIILWFQGNGTWSSVEHASSPDLSRTK